MLLWIQSNLETIQRRSWCFHSFLLSLFSPDLSYCPDSPYPPGLSRTHESPAALRAWPRTVLGCGTQNTGDTRWYDLRTDTFRYELTAASKEESKAEKKLNKCPTFTFVKSWIEYPPMSSCSLNLQAIALLFNVCVCNSLIYYCFLVCLIRCWFFLFFMQVCGNVEDSSICIPCFV